MSDYEGAIRQLVNTMQEKLFDLQTEKASQVNIRNSMTSRIANLRKTKADLINQTQYLEEQIHELTQGSSTYESERSKLSLQLQGLAEKITLTAEQAKAEKIAWNKESDFIQSKLVHLESQYRIEASEEQKYLKMKSQELSRLEQELANLNEELKENQSKVQFKRELEHSRVNHLDERSKILDSIYKA